MPANARNKIEDRMDERSKAIQSNPCGICRSLGLPICKGHGGGGGGGGGGNKSNEDQSNTASPRYVPNNIEVKLLSSYLEKSEVWSYVEDFLYNFNNDLAIFSIKLDFAKGLILFKANQSLNHEDQKDLDELYAKIEVEFKKFTHEVRAENFSLFREGNDLKINIPDPKLFDQFVTRLLNNNLIPNNNYKFDLNYTQYQSPRQTLNDKPGDPIYKSPNPFDISNGPRPPDDPKKRR